MRLMSHAENSPRTLSPRPVLARSGAVIATAAAIAALVAGCGSDSKTSQPSGTTTGSASGTTSATGTPALPQAATIVAESAKTTETLRSLHVALIVTGLTLPMETVNADVTNEPQGNGRAVGDAKVRLQPNGPVQPFDFVVTDKTMYTKQPDGKYQSVGPAEKIYDPGIVLDKEKGLANVIKSVQNPKSEGKETINGVPTVKVTGTVDGAVVDPVIPQLGKGGGTLPITLYIADVPPGASPTNIPSDAPSPGTGPNLVRMVINKDQGNVDVTLSNWAKPVDIPNPTG